jgi:hypothetical protein
VVYWESSGHLVESGEESFPYVDIAGAVLAWMGPFRVIVEFVEVARKEEPVKVAFESVARGVFVSVGLVSCRMFRVSSSEDSPLVFETLAPRT